MASPHRGLAAVACVAMLGTSTAQHLSIILAARSCHLPKLPLRSLPALLASVSDIHPVLHCTAINHTTEAMTWLEAEAHASMYDRGGFMSTADAGISILAGSTLGGGAAWRAWVKSRLWSCERSQPGRINHAAGGMSSHLRASASPCRALRALCACIEARCGPSVPWRSRIEGA